MHFQEVWLLVLLSLGICEKISSFLPFSFLHFSSMDIINCTILGHTTEDIENMYTPNFLTSHQISLKNIIGKQAWKKMLVYGEINVKNDFNFHSFVLLKIFHRKQHSLGCYIPIRLWNGSISGSKGFKHGLLFKRNMNFFHVKKKHMHHADTFSWMKLIISGSASALCLTRM